MVTRTGMDMINKKDRGMRPATDESNRGRNFVVVSWWRGQGYLNQMGELFIRKG